MKGRLRLAKKAALLFAEGVKGQVRSLSFGSLSIARAHSASRRGD